MGKTLHLVLTTNCNIRCKYCFYNQWDDRNADEQLSKQTFLNIIENVQNLDITKIAFTGGEPLLHNDIVEFAELAAKRGIELSITTNGKLLTVEKIHKLINAGVKHFALSLDSLDNEINMSLRGNMGSVHTLEIFRILSGFKGTHLSFITVITSKNFDGIQNLFMYSAKNKIKMTIQPIMYNQENNLCKDLYQFDFESPKWSRFKHIIGVWDKYYSNSKGYDKKVISYLEQKDFLVEPCSQNDKMIVMYPNGNIFSCFNQYNNCLGNINKDPCSEILENMRIYYRDFIKPLKCYRKECISMQYCWEKRKYLIGNY